MVALPYPTMAFDFPDGETLLVRLAGEWRLGSGIPSTLQMEENLASRPDLRRILFETNGILAWDSGLITTLVKILDLCGRLGIEADPSGLPEGAQRLLRLAAAVPEPEEVKPKEGDLSYLRRVGAKTLRSGAAASRVFGFIGETALSLGRFFIGRARFRGADLLLFLQQGGSQAFPIVTLISVLVGLILAFVGAVQLRMFGAEPFIANLVGLGMARDMGAMMTGVIMAGRTGASYAAQLGTMEVNGEIDAFRTLGIPPMDYLVLPRLLALTLMMPLLTIYSVFMGMLGGALVGIGLFEITPVQYLLQTRDTVTLNHCWVGLAKSAVYGGIVAFCGCLRGMHCGRSAAAVGEATTSAVVTSIVWIVISCALLTILFHILGV